MYTAQWNDDIHHSLHTLVTGEGDGYYGDYAGSGARHLARCLAEGFAYQGEPSPYRDNRLRGESSAHLPPKIGRASCRGRGSGRVAAGVGDAAGRSEGRGGRTA